MKELGINRSMQTHIDTQIRDERKENKKKEVRVRVGDACDSPKRGKKVTKQEPKGNTAFQSESSASPEVLTLRTKTFELMSHFFFL